MKAADPPGHKVEATRRGRHSQMTTTRSRTRPG